MRLHFILAAVATVVPCSRAAAQGRRAGPTAEPRYHVARRVRLGGTDGWDYLVADTGATRLYVTHGTHVMVVDTRTDSVVGDVANTPGAHGVALVPELGRGYVSNGRDSSVTVFDLRTLAQLARLRVPGRNPDAITYDSASRRVFTFNGGSADATAFDAPTGGVAGTIPLGGKPEFAVTDGRGTLYVNIEDRGEIAAVDTRALTVRARWPIAPCEEPSGLAIDRAHRRLFAVCANGRMAVVDADAGRVVASVPIGARPDAAAFDPATQLAFSSNGEGTLTVVHEDSPDQFRVVQTVATQRGARTMALDPATHRVYSVTADLGPAPAPTPEQPHPRPTVVPNTFTLLVVEP
jgi:DNA-binding beta-propeller fold protein YncE